MLPMVLPLDGSQTDLFPHSTAIMAQELESPAYAAADLWKTKPQTNQLPKLRFLTDVLWGYWNRDNSNIRNINWYIVQQVENVDAVKLIARALRNKKKTLAPWPGTTFSMDSDEGHAILGTILRHLLPASVPRSSLSKCANTHQVHQSAQPSPISSVNTRAHWASKPLLRW